MTQPLGFDYMEILNRSNHLKSQNTSNSAPRAANMINHWDLTTRRLNFDRWKWRSNPQNGPKLGCKAKCGQKLQRKIIWVGQSDEKWSLLQRIQCQIISLITCISLSLSILSIWSMLTFLLLAFSSRTQGVTVNSFMCRLLCLLCWWSQSWAQRRAFDFSVSEAGTTHD